MKRGGSDLTGGVICYNVYRASDGYMTISALEPEFWAAFCEGIRRVDLIGQQFARAVPGEPAYDALCALFRSRTRQEWVEAFSDVDACCEPVYNLEEALASDPVEALRILSSSGLRPPVRFSEKAVESPLAAPGMGEDTIAILGELGYSPSEVDQLRLRGIV
jgi:crotonobetainyl-CoA:carnitine CoA-transferase CaiB-like acyl-CoA transferase